MRNRKTTKIGKMLGAVAVGVMLMVMTLGSAGAWPDLPPTKALISGPGLEGQVAITDPAVLTALRLGGLEDFEKGAMPAPSVSAVEPYKIIRYFEGGTFQMGDLTYYPNAQGASVVYFQDGPMKEGDRSPFNNQWFATKATSDQLLRKFIHTAETGTPTERAWLVHDGSSKGETIAYDGVTTSPRFILPKGMRSADGNAYWATFAAGGLTALHSFDLANGSITNSLSYEGDWQLGAVSAMGKWLALKRTPSESEIAAMTNADAWKTTVAVVDTETGKTTRTIALNGNFDVDALNAAGTGLFLIEHLPASKPDHYQVRRYDMALGQLQEGIIVDKRNANEVMAGYPTTQVASKDGQWLFTLYVGMQEEHAFIHALNLNEGYAWCIDLPSGDGDPAMLEHYALALHPNGTTVYASNAVLGTLASADAVDIDEAKVVQFTAPLTSVPSGEPIRSSAVSRDGKFVYMSDGGKLWQYDTKANSVRILKNGTMPILGLTMNAENNALLVAQADHAISTLPLSVAVNVGGTP